MKKPHHLLPLGLILSLFLNCCSNATKPCHEGLIPFRWMESAPTRGISAFTQRGSFFPAEGDGMSVIAALRPGDVIAFHMSHAEARAYLRRGKLQKLPYELFRCGHLALVVPHKSSGDWRLLQTAMGQCANAEQGRAYLMDKAWTVYRPNAKKLDVAKLAEFTQAVMRSAPRYDMVATMGLRNHGLAPKSVRELSPSYTCATLVVAAMHYAGCKIHVTDCGGVMDVITPGQVVGARMQVEAER